MDPLFWGLTIGLAGKVLLGVSVVMVHGKVAHEHRIDRAVIREMRRERNIALLAILLIFVGYLLELSAFGVLGA